MLIVHDTDGKECWVTCYACMGRLTSAEKWLIDLKCEEATKLLKYAANGECVDDLQCLFDEIPESEAKKAMGPLSKSWFETWVEIQDISSYSHNTHCVIHIRSMSSC